MLVRSESEYAHLTLPRGSTKLRVQSGRMSEEKAPRELNVTLPAPLQGTPALGDTFVLLPLAEEGGILARLDLETGLLTKLLNWRAVGAEAQARGYVVLFHRGEGVMTDGARGLFRISSSDGKTWTKGREKPFAHRITGPPVLLQGEDAGSLGMCVADASNTITILDFDRLNVRQSWLMPGKITAGPFARGSQIGCVVERNLLVWINPKEKESVWEYRFADILGEPHLIGDDLIVGDVAGRFVALDPKDGGPRGPVLTLKANVAATAAPLPFGPGRAFVPLTDGTIVILPLAKLRAAK